MKNDNAFCGNCKHFNKTRVGSPLPGKSAVALGECLRYPPKVIAGPQGPLTLFPLMQATQTCGEHQINILV